MLSIGCGGKGSLAISLSRWHWLSWQHGKNMYPKEGEHGYERPPDAKALEEACLGGVVEDLDNALEAEDAERDDELDGAGGVARRLPAEAALVQEYDAQPNVLVQVDHLWPRHLQRLLAAARALETCVCIRT